MADTYVFIFSLLCLFNIIESSVGEKELLNLKGTVKTKHAEYDVIDCIDILQQPALEYPLFQNHGIQMVPPQKVKHISNASEEPFFYETWNELEECPEGTVPIKRIEEINDKLVTKMKDESVHINFSNAVANKPVHEYATVRVDEGKYYGTKFAATVWNPRVEPNDLSLAQIWITAGPNDALNAIEVGWMVYPSRYKDNRTRLFTFWTNDGYKTICYDQRCTGFVQLSRKVYPGAPLASLSQYGSRNYAVWITIFKSKENWYLQVGEEVVGYWPGYIFPLLRDAASNLAWGGEVVYAPNNRHHTTTQMGSGHYANENMSRAASEHKRRHSYF